ncbi:carbohydrate ABC transporter permease [Rhizobium binae]|uniref:carbohydrate ABC transporter permease n=1 Tax=Rhizobium binae TaxID=1138190 RepID=UPI001C82E1FE|nr:carbohydrate ABC transporter permease [Rhizobium binae]MBX4937479.1 carbohydrate ABC transporter permease [Rhizobium binae]MBX4944317.1 carbohydrate ABC transporter permease [Rhizobium binae]MBX4962243.1 carbohydrate ABC transporter permease [Rhizobium binae]MBX4969252.1 carbohydrate ABC transporter permease [Rhizobium binae]MBX4979548.1 carbohydrate ABC transporter permease [Rhizobium binae]
MTTDASSRHPHSLSRNRHRLLRRIGTFISYAGLSLIALLFLFPFFWMVSNAVRSNTEVLAVPVRILPEEYHWGNFVEALVSLPFGIFLMNSFIVACGVTAIVLVVSCLSAYAFARLRFAGREGLLLTYLSTLMIPQVMLVIPLFLVVSKLGWINTYHGMILPVAFSSFGTFLLRQFILGIPKDLDEAAMMDGASRLRILVTVIVPLAMPAIGLLSLFTFIAQWKSFLWPLIATSGLDKATLPLGLTLFQTQQGTAWNYIMAGATISMVPGVILAIVLQRVIYKGITVGSGFGGR